MDEITKYNEEINEDVKMSEFNLKDKQMMLPGIKHKWVARLINHKRELAKLKSLKITAKEKIMAKYSTEASVHLSRPVIDKKTESHDVIKKINKNIKEEELTIVYLEKVEAIFRGMSFDIKNLIDIMKLEET